MGCAKGYKSNCIYYTYFAAVAQWESVRLKSISQIPESRRFKSCLRQISIYYENISIICNIIILKLLKLLKIIVDDILSF